MCKTTWHGNNWKWKEVERNGWELKSKNRNQFSSKRLCNSYLGRSVTYLSIMMYCKFASWRVTFFHEKLLTHKSLCLSRVSFYIALCFFITWWDFFKCVSWKNRWTQHTTKWKIKVTSVTKWNNAKNSTQVTW